MRRVETMLALAAVLSLGAAAMPALSAKNGTGTDPETSAKGMTSAKRMMSQTAPMMEHCSGMMESPDGSRGGNRPNDQWRRR